MEKEKIIIDEIIKYKISNNIKYDFFETKKTLIDIELSKIQTNIICGNLSFKDYKKLLAKHLSYEEILSDILNKDSEFKEDEKNIIKERINDRILILNEELNQEIEEEEEGGEEIDKDKVEYISENKVNKKEDENVFIKDFDNIDNNIEKDKDKEKEKEDKRKFREIKEGKNL